MKKVIIGISAYYHDSAACLLIDGKLVAAIQEERFTRIKHDASFPTQALKYMVEHYLDDDTTVIAVCFYEKPYLTFERLLETYHAFAPKGWKSFLKAMPVWVKEKIFIKKDLQKKIMECGIYNATLYFTEHHLSHAASAFYPSPFSEAAILTVDGVGEWATVTISKGTDTTIEVIKELTFPHSLGLLYSAFTWYCGFKVNSGEFKLMGLAPYGNEEEETTYFVRLITDHLVDIREDGSFLLNMKYFNYATGLTMTHDRHWEQLFGFSRRKEGEEISQQHMNFALAIQKVTNLIMLRLAQTAQQLTGSDHLVIAGGVALNCVSNGVLEVSKIFKRIWVQPAAGDAGACIGAALTVQHRVFDQIRHIEMPDKMNNMYLGPEYHENDIQRFMTKVNAVAHRYDADEILSLDVARLLAEGNVIGWFQGRMEFGPRALGNRSILADPRSATMQQKLNLKIKFRESFRPFAPVVLLEDLGDYFSDPTPSPYMMFVRKLKKEICYVLPEQYGKFDLARKLYTPRSPIPAVTHIDYSARVQSVSKESNFKLWNLIRDFKSLTQTGMIINTSFNVRGEPIVNTPQDAFNCFMNTEMDYLVMGNFLFDKKEQKKVVMKNASTQFDFD